ncbi:hypothetical protein [Roseiflexus sp.]|uniref:hypothetical protein n=1 Tax=Roseiflexus sp. TaxID=2562120 RepID=UPI00398A6C68
MKTLWRVLIILAAASVVVAALVALRQTGWAETWLPDADRAHFEAGIERGRFAPDSFERHERGGFTGERDRIDRGHGAERTPDARGIIEVVRNLLIIGVIVALVVGASLIARRLLRRRSPPRAEAGPLA